MVQNRPLCIVCRSGEGGMSVFFCAVLSRSVLSVSLCCLVFTVELLLLSGFERGGRLGCRIPSS